jgi:Xaa-Pro aminopeptidase
MQWADELTAIMKEFGISGASLGLDNLDPIGFAALSRLELRLVNAEEVLQLAKAVKTQDEILIYEEVGKLYGSIMRAFRERAIPGITDKELSSLIYATVVGLGAEGLLQINVCSGGNMNPWRRWPTDRRLANSDLVGLDLHVYGPGGYIFDSSRTYLCGGPPSEKQRDRYRRAYDYVNAVIDLFRPGVSIENVKANLPKVPESFHELLYSFHIAHSNGLTPGEYPSIVKHQKPVRDTIKENMVLSVDCYFGEIGDDVAVKLEDQILVTGTGAKRMADMPYDERLL